MGVSTDALLFWGFPLDDEFNAKWEDESEFEYDGWENYYAIKVAGITPSPEEYETDEDKRLHSVFWDESKEANKIHKCSIGYHCSDKYPMYYVSIEYVGSSARRGYPEKIENLDVEKEWEDILRKFCTDMGIEWQEPGWYLASWWG